MLKNIQRFVLSHDPDHCISSRRTLEKLHKRAKPKIAIHLVNMALGKYDDAIKHFKSYYINRNDEVHLYMLLRWLLYIK
ncbi:MAG: hypothetical protein FH756_13290 [Firmicutes bacterium]|nr:hypothetical protein [Bacillota bacterium]